MTSRLVRNVVSFAVGVAIAAVALLATAAPLTVQERATWVASVHRMHEPLASCTVVMIAPERAITAAHCTNMESPVVTIGDMEYPVTEAYTNVTRDMAVLVIPGAPCPCAIMDVRALVEGETVTVVGYPFGVPVPVVTYGEVQGRLVTDDGQEIVLATAPVAPGNSGGAVFDEYGSLIGVLIGMIGANHLSAYSEFAGAAQPREHKKFGAVSPDKRGATDNPFPAQ